ncbi:MAG: flagellar hook-length control protein FliK [Geobacter sp.]|nr:MAG: flagellar hook-length control protein FliK [Geobacter sp.]
MDVAQIITSAVAPGAAALPTSSESSASVVTPASLFGEMFAKAAATTAFSGKLSGNAFVKQQSIDSQIPTPERLMLNANGADLSAPMFAMFAGESMPVDGEQEMTGLPDGQLGALLPRAMAHRKTAEESAWIPEQRGLSFHKSRENKGEAKAALSEGQLETELVSGSGVLSFTAVSSQEILVEESETMVSNREVPHQRKADEADVPALVSLPAGLVRAMEPAAVAQNVSSGVTVGRLEVSTPPVHFVAVATVAREGNEAVREILPVVKGDTVPSQQPQASFVDGKPNLFVANAGFGFDSTEKKVVSLVPPKTTGPENFPGNGATVSSAGSEFTSRAVEVTGVTMTAGLVEGAPSPDFKEVADVVLGGEKLVGKDHGNVARHENGLAMKEAMHDQTTAGKGETVLRELPSGVTVLNPAQTVTMGRSAITADAAFLNAQVSERGRISGPDGEAREEKGREISLAGESQKTVLKNEGFSSQDNSNLSHDSGTSGQNHTFSPATGPSGSFDTIIKGQIAPLSQVPQESEVSALHENILSQVREKLVNQDPSSNVSKITLKLNPHELGELQINVRLENQKMTVDITAQNPVVKEALLQNIDQLKDTLLRQNISMERFNVTTGDGGGQAFNQSFREGRQTAYQAPDTHSYSLSGYYQEDSQASQVAFGDSKENSLVDMRF